VIFETQSIFGEDMDKSMVSHAKTVEVRIMQFSPYSSPIPLVFAHYVSSGNSDGFPLNGGVKQGWGRKISQFSANNSPYLRNGAR